MKKITWVSELMRRSRFLKYVVVLAAGVALVGFVGDSSAKQAEDSCPSGRYRLLQGRVRARYYKVAPARHRPSCHCGDSP
mgnify:CR=1 FL=1